MSTEPLPLPESFALTLRGYDREQVGERLAELGEEPRLTEAAVLVAEAERGLPARSPGSVPSLRSV